MVTAQTTQEERKVGNKLLKELEELLHPDMSGNYVDFDKPRKDLWIAFKDRWGAVVHLRSPRIRRDGV